MSYITVYWLRSAIWFSFSLFLLLGLVDGNTTNYIITVLTAAGATDIFTSLLKVLSTDGHLPAEMLGAGKQNSQQYLGTLVVTDVTGFCVYSKQKCLWHFLIDRLAEGSGPLGPDALRP
jgi:hypothetical protein